MTYLPLIFKLMEFLAAVGIDKIIAKYLAYFMIAWQNLANEKAKAQFDSAINDVKLNAPAKAKAWEDWRKKAMQNDG